MISRRSILAFLGLAPAAAGALGLSNAPLPYPEPLLDIPFSMLPKTLSTAQVDETISAVLNGADILPWERYVTNYPELYPRWIEASIARSVAAFGMTHEQAEKCWLCWVGGQRLGKA